MTVMLDRRCMLGLIGTAALAPKSLLAQEMSRMTAYAFTFGGLNGGEIRLGDYADKLALVVNTASLCGYTNQYSGLEKLYDVYKARGLTVIGVPSNDFGGQEPGGAKEITATVEAFKVDFPMTEKAVVKGPGAHRFYRWAAAERPKETPAWNFHKYLIGRDGRIAAVFPSAIEPEDPRMIAAIERALLAPTSSQG
jgi:glutathione peroxidase